MKFEQTTSRTAVSLRPLLWLALLSTLLLSGGCGDGLTSFTITEESGEQVIEGGTFNQIVDLPFNPFTFEVNLEQELQKRDAGPAKGVYLKGLELQVTDTEEPEGDSDDLGFLKNMTLYVSAEGESRQKIAWKDSIPAEASFQFETDDQLNLKPYIEKGMKLETEAEGNRPDDATSIKALITLRIRAL